MKHVLGVVLLLVVCGLAVTGCGKKEEPAPPAAVVPGQPAPPTVQAPAPVLPEVAPTVTEKVVDISTQLAAALALGKEGKYTEAIAAVQKLLATPGLTEAQKTSLADALAQLQKWAAEAATKSATEKLPAGIPSSLPLK